MSILQQLIRLLQELHAGKITEWDIGIGKDRMSIVVEPKPKKYVMWVLLFPIITVIANFQMIDFLAR